MHTRSQSAGKTCAPEWHLKTTMEQNKELSRILAKFKGKEKALRYFLAGFADGESSFSVAIIKHPTAKFGWMINPCFQVYQHEKHREILEMFKFVFNEGSIYRKSGVHPVLNYSINSMRGIQEKVIPFFEKHPLIVKEETFKTFCAIVRAMERKEHLTIQGFKKVVDMAYTMNQQGKGRKHSKEEIFATLPKT